MQSPIFFLRALFGVLIVLNLFACGSSRKVPLLETEELTIRKLTPHLYQHISQLSIPNFGNFPCNGMVFIKNGEAVVFDSPVGKQATRQLIAWLKEEQKVAVKGIVINHFHDDCVDGLEIFHQEGVESYANRTTIDLVDEGNFAVPQHGFIGGMILEVGGSLVHNRYFGQAHTIDNIVSWIPDERAIFGGCMVKSLGAGKGNVNDANVEEWPETIRKVKAAFPSLKIVVPGHGEPGGPDLLDYTSQLFASGSVQNP